MSIRPRIGVGDLCMCVAPDCGPIMLCVDISPGYSLITAAWKDERGRILERRFHRSRLAWVGIDLGREI